jgi:hypothetical protein
MGRLRAKLVGVAIWFLQYLKYQLNPGLVAMNRMSRTVTARRAHQELRVHSQLVTRFAHYFARVRYKDRSWKQDGRASEGINR